MMVRAIRPALGQVALSGAAADCVASTVEPLHHSVLTFGIGGQFVSNAS